MRCIFLVTLLLTACTAPPPAASPAASPDVPSPSAATATVERPTQTAPAQSPTTSPVPPTVAATATETATPTSTVMPTPEPERLLVVGSGSPAVNMRAEPGTGSAVVRSIRDGTEVIVVGTDREADGRIWRNVRDGDATGWIVGTALRPLPTPTVTPSRTPTSAAMPTPVPSTPTTSAPPATPAAPTATPAPEVEPERAEVVGTGGQGANLRAQPGTSGALLKTVPEGTRVTIIGPDRDVDGRTWRNVRLEDGTEGWLIAEAVQSLAEPTPTPAPTETATPVPTSTPAVTLSPTVAASTFESATGTPMATPAPAETPSVPADPGEPSAPEGEPEEPTPEPESVEVFETGGTGANLRAQPGRSGSVLASVPDGSQLTVVGEDEVADGITWRHVRTEAGVTGWLATEVIRTVVRPTPTPRPGSAGIGAPLPVDPQPESELSEAQLAARPCRPGQIKGDATNGTYYPADHPDYPTLLQRIRCFDDESRARASGFLPPEAPEPSPSPEPEP